jgi:hypothetical protein
VDTLWAPRVPTPPVSVSGPGTLTTRFGHPLGTQGAHSPGIGFWPGHPHTRFGIYNIYKGGGAVPVEHTQRGLGQCPALYARFSLKRVLVFFKVGDVFFKIACFEQNIQFPLPLALVPYRSPRRSTPNHTKFC